MFNWDYTFYANKKHNQKDSVNVIRPVLLTNIDSAQGLSNKLQGIYFIIWFRGLLFLSKQYLCFNQNDSMKKTIFTTATQTIDGQCSSLLHY